MNQDTLGSIRELNDNNVQITVDFSELKEVLEKLLRLAPKKERPECHLCNHCIVCKDFLKYDRGYDKNCPYYESA